jgi:integrase/recombinase XerD
MLYDKLTGALRMVQKDYLAENRFEGLTANSLQSYVNLFKNLNEWLAKVLKELRS